jgi:outer membrane protein, heavy metal efflux system
MTSWKPIGLLLACTLASAASAAEADPLTLQQSLTLAAERSPALRAARHEQAAAQGAGHGAGALPNPVVTAGVGVRTSSAALDVGVGLSQSLPVAQVGPARRTARQTAEVSASWAEDAWRHVVADVSGSFFRVAHADARILIADESVELASAVLRSVRTRAQAGDAASLDVVIAELAHSRATAQATGERAAREQAAGALALALDLTPSTISVSGPLLERSRYAPHLLDVAERPDLLALQKEARLADARSQLARAHALPGFGLWAGYDLEEGASIVSGGLSLELPFFDRAQGERGEAAARTRQADDALEFGRRAASAQLDTASRVYSLRVQVADVLEADALPRALTQSDAAARAFELGALALPELLLIRGQAMQARIDHVDAELAAAIAGVELLAAAGWTP